MTAIAVTDTYVQTRRGRPPRRFATRRQQQIGHGRADRHGRRIAQIQRDAGAVIPQRFTGMAEDDTTNIHHRAVEVCGYRPRLLDFEQNNPDHPQRPSRKAFLITAMAIGGRSFDSVVNAVSGQRIKHRFKQHTATMLAGLRIVSPR